MEGTKCNVEHIRIVHYDHNDAAFIKAVYKKLKKGTWILTGFVAVIIALSPYITRGGPTILAKDWYFFAILPHLIIWAIIGAYFYFKIFVRLQHDIRSQLKSILCARIVKMVKSKKGHFEITLDCKKLNRFTVNTDYKLRENDLIEIHFLERSQLVLDVKKMNVKD